MVLFFLCCLTYNSQFSLLHKFLKVNSAENIIESLYNQINTQGINNSNKSEILYNLIFIKAELQNDVYVDIKNFLRSYIESMEEKKYGYDTLNLSKIKECVNLLSKDQRITMFEYCKKLLIKSDLEQEWEILKNEYYKSKIINITSSNLWFLNPLVLIKCLYLKSIYSYKYLLLFIFILLVGNYVTLLPNNNNLWPSLFSVKYETISDNFYLNHLSNISLSLFEIDTEFKVIPLNLLGTVCLIIGKVIKVVLIVKFVSDKILKKLSIDE